MTDDTTDKRLSEALTNAKKAARAIADAIATSDMEAHTAYHRNDAIARLELALSALRAVKQ